MSKRKDIDRNKEFIDVIIDHLIPEDDPMVKQGIKEWPGNYWDKTNSYRARTNHLALLHLLTKAKGIDVISDLKEEIDNLYELLDDVREKVKRKVDRVKKTGAGR